MMNKLEAPDSDHLLLLLLFTLVQVLACWDISLLLRSESTPELRHGGKYNCSVGITGTAELLSGVMLLVILQVNFTAVCQSPTTLPLYFLIISTLLNGLICIFYLSRWRRERCVFFIDVQPTGIQWHNGFTGYKLIDSPNNI
ncbi:hypothetical protein PMAYCL1PPCAC_13509 [Pristionchus mayeri]|uniref:Uncharacterized protein n=1 Tax=Pristionchus mayeri TaxID=1317129 RepID=A0AAN4ZNV3_9BILA|nr:hypothetical protein PMAYCL1PPCAC_13509 [Pristionchus mayeri]